MYCGQTSPNLSFFVVGGECMREKMIEKDRKIKQMHCSILSFNFKKCF